jgi:glycosyltransferase involved in cell wall biosynthesis
VEGLAVRPDRDAYVTDDPEVMAERIGDLLERPALRAEMGAQGTAFVRSRYGWDPLIRRLAQEVEAAGPAGTRRPRPTLEAPVGAMERG